MHTSFKLSSIGEEIAVYDAELNLVDAFVFAAQDTDVSQGRSTDGAAAATHGPMAARTP